MKTQLHAYPFLKGIPFNILSLIDLDVLHLPSLSEKEWIDRLSAEIQKNIVVYKNEHIHKGAHLCRMLQPAALTPVQLDVLNAVEKRFAKGFVVVAYDKPLRLVTSDGTSQMLRYTDVT